NNRVLTRPTCNLHLLDPWESAQLTPFWGRQLFVPLPTQVAAVCSRRGQYRINSSSSYPIVPSDDTNTTSQPLQQKSNRRSPAIDDVQEKDKEEGEEMEEEEYMKRVQGTPLQETLSPSQKLRCRNRSGPASAASPKQKKRGHKTKKFPEPPTLPSDPKPEGDGDTFPIDPHRRHILESNRIAATKFRLRKRDEASALATMQQAVKDQNRHLSSSFDSLLAEKYIAHGVKTSAGNMEGASEPFSRRPGPLKLSSRISVDCSNSVAHPRSWLLDHQILEQANPLQQPPGTPNPQAGPAL
ncbi:hypothetical protein S40288_11685, partial [Stachybotrys chartarum IBT 40288]